MALRIFTLLKKESKKGESSEIEIKNEMDQIVVKSKELIYSLLGSLESEKIDFEKRWKPFQEKYFSNSEEKDFLDVAKNNYDCFPKKLTDFIKKTSEIKDLKNFTDGEDDRISNFEVVLKHTHNELRVFNVYKELKKEKLNKNDPDILKKQERMNIFIEHLELKLEKLKTQSKNKNNEENKASSAADMKEPLILPSEKNENQEEVDENNKTPNIESQETLELKIKIIKQLREYFKNRADSKEQYSSCFASFFKGGYANRTIKIDTAYKVALSLASASDFGNKENESKEGENGKDISRFMTFGLSHLKAAKDGRLGSICDDIQKNSSCLLGFNLFSKVEKHEFKGYESAARSYALR